MRASTSQHYAWQTDVENNGLALIGSIALALAAVYVCLSSEGENGGFTVLAAAAAFFVICRWFNVLPWLGQAGNDFSASWSAEENMGPIDLSALQSRLAGGATDVRIRRVLKTEEITTTVRPDPMTSPAQPVTADEKHGLASLAATLGSPAPFIQQLPIYVEDVNNEENGTEYVANEEDLAYDQYVANEEDLAYDQYVANEEDLAYDQYVANEKDLPYYDDNVANEKDLPYYDDNVANEKDLAYHDDYVADQEGIQTEGEAMEEPVEGDADWYERPEGVYHVDIGNPQVVSYLQRIVRVACLAAVIYLALKLFKDNRFSLHEPAYSFKDYCSPLTMLVVVSLCFAGAAHLYERTFLNQTGLFAF